MSRYVDEGDLIEVAVSAVVDRTDRIAVRAALERWLARQPTAPDLVGATVAAHMLGVKPPYISRLKEQGRMPEPVEVEGSVEAYVREEVEVLAAEIERDRRRRAERRAREEAA